MNTRPADFVDVTSVSDKLIIDMRYASDNNFVGKAIDGYLASKAYLTKPAAAALAKAAELANEQGLTIKILDAYRPQKAVSHFKRWAESNGEDATKALYHPNLTKQELFSCGYVATHSSHSRGSSVDLTLEKDGEELDMGTPFDQFDEMSHTAADAISSSARHNRDLLLDIMQKAGFINFEMEWWHYTLDKEPYPDTYFDFNIE